ncbi:TIR domain-containing protein [Parasphingopyxis sp.]|uniref:TIR domain-containing protein n=1 Tax=Parasphingopyxis sp. TaxID=1920299 RepID=UPI0026237A0B|nr:TIR domain-containing protein [Parasphingopyxis sp.]
MAEGGADTGGSGQTGRRPVAFISHHSSQEKTARHLKEVLERNGVQGWMAPDDIDPGVAFDQAIIEQVEKSDLIVLLFCSQSDQSRHVKRELMMAEDRKKLIYPVRLEDIDAKGLAYWLNDYQWIDWIDRRDATIERLIATIKRQVDTGEAPAEPVIETPGAPEETPEPNPPPVAAAPAAAASADTRPVGLMSSGGDSSDPDAPAKFLGITLNRTGWYVIGGGAVLVAILLGLLVNSLSGSGEYELRAGEWETRYEIDRILSDGGLPRSEVDSFRADFDAEVETQCITAEQVRTPLVDFFDPEGDGNCSMSNLTMEDGIFRVRLDCRPEDLGGETVQVFMRGDYTETAINAEAEYVFSLGGDNEFRFVANQTGTYVGACD